MIVYPEPIPTWSWKELDGKIVKIRFVPSNPELLEFDDLVCFMDEDGKIYVLDVNIK